MTQTDPLLGRRIRDNILLQAVLGGGGMGRVYKGIDENLGRTVAVKVLRPENEDVETARVYFEREARAASRLWHPNIIQIIDFGVEPDGTLFLVMEFVPGHNLADILEEDFPLGTERIVRILSQLLTALEEAHKQNIVHRDLKPENIMLQDVPGNPDFVKVLDFGVAKSIGVDKAGPMTIQGLVMGTPHFMSPEQALGHEVDARSDLYSVGAILYQVLTCDLPFDGELVMNVLARVITERPVPPSQRRPEYPIDEGLERICMRALRKNVEGRFQTAAEFRDALQALLDSEKPARESSRNRGVGAISQTDLEPVRRRNRSAFTDSVFDFIDQADADVEGQRATVATLAVQVRAADRRGGPGRDVLSDFQPLFERAVQEAGGMATGRVGPISTAIFGHPSGLDDPIQAAVRAGHALRKAVGELDTVTALGFGVAHGVVVVPHDDAAGSYGSPVDRALQLAAAASASQILVDESARQTPTAIELVATDRDGVYDVAREQVEAQREPTDVAARPRLPLLDREEQVRALQRLIERVASGRAISVAIVGLPGSGKSRLLSLLAREAEQQRIAVINADAEPYPSAQPATVLRRIVGSSLELIPADEPGAALADLGLSQAHCRVLEHLLIGEAPAEHAPFWVDALKVAFAAFMRALVRRTPVLIVSDQFGSIDLISFSVLRHVTDQLADAPLGIVGAGDGSIPLVRRFSEQHGSIRLQGLSDHTVERTLAREFPQLDQRVIEAVVEQVNGVPRQLALLVEHLRTHAVVDPDDLPAHPMEVLLERLEALPESARKLLAIAGALGPSFPLHALANSCPRSWDLRENLSIVGRAGLLALTEDRIGDWLRFEPAELAPLALEQLPTEVRRKIHLRIARYFEQLSDETPSPEFDYQRARQIGAAGDEVGGIRLLTQSAEHTLDKWGRLATMPVVDVVLDGADESLVPGSELHQDVLLRAGVVLVHAEYYEEARHVLASIGGPDEVRPDLRARLLWLRAATCLGLDQLGLAARELDGVDEHLLAHNTLDAARVALTRARILEAEKSFGAAIRAARRAWEIVADGAIPRGPWDNELVWHPPLLESRVRIFRQEFEEAASTLERALDETLQLEDSRGVVRLNHALAFCLRSLGRPEDARNCLQEAIAASVRCGDVRTRVRLMNDLAAIHLDRQMRDSARKLLEDALDLAHSLGLREMVRVNRKRLAQLSEAS